MASDDWVCVAAAPDCSVTASVNANRMRLASPEGTVRWDLTWPSGLVLEHAAFSPDGTLIGAAVQSSDWRQAYRAWVQEGREVRMALDDGPFRGELRVWAVPDGRAISSIAFDDPILHFAFGPSATIVTGHLERAMHSALDGSVLASTSTTNVFGYGDAVGVSVHPATKCVALAVYSSRKIAGGIRVGAPSTAQPQRSGSSGRDRLLDDNVQCRRSIDLRHRL